MEVFVKYLLLHQGYFGMDYPPAFLDLPHPPTPQYALRAL